MCGIAGYISTRSSEVAKEIIERMTDAVAHRGPDGAGVWVHGSVALGHRRLSILDLSELGRQPMIDPDSGRVITFNGEIYNYIELRRILAGQGYRFRSHTDTEVILNAYDFWGQRCVEQFNGMWSFAIYDPRENLLFCSRDRFGVKPFYYAETTAGFAFGSEIRQLLPLLPSRQADAQVLLGFLVARVAEDITHSFFSGVRKLPGGHNLVFDLAAQKYTISRYYSLEVQAGYVALQLDEAVNVFQELFRDAIRLRLRSDVRVGTCLSGGMDSSSIATLAAEAYRRESQQAFLAITAVSEDPQTDESQFAQRVVENAGLEWIIVKPGYSDFCDQLAAVVRAQEEPFASASVLMQFFVMREARRAGVPVLLDGQGGDETLLGYDRYFADHFLQSLRKGKLAAALAVVSGLLRNGRRGALSILLRDLLYFHAPAVRRMATRNHSSLFRPEVGPSLRAARVPARDYGGLSAMQKDEIERTNLPVLLRYEDKNSMAHSIETRLPFLDYRLVEFATSVATSLKLHDGWGKYLLRRSMAGQMPEAVVWRKNKFGFEAPESRWMRLYNSQIQAAVRSSCLLSQICRENALQGTSLDQFNQGMRWRLFSLALWENEFAVTGMT